MTLRLAALADLSTTLQSDFAWPYPLILISPDGVEQALRGRYDDTGASVDTGTGQYISGRFARAHLRASDLNKIPKDTRNGRPWLLKVKGLDGVDYMWRVARVEPDLTMGIITVQLDYYAINN